jgi:hypothetical protein
MRPQQSSIPPKRRGRPPGKAKAPPPVRAANDLIQQVLFSRSQLARRWGTTVSFIQRLERQGVLQGKRLNPHAPTGMVFFTLTEIQSHEGTPAGAQQGGDDAQ